MASIPPIFIEALGFDFELKRALKQRKIDEVKIKELKEERDEVKKMNRQYGQTVRKYKEKGVSEKKAHKLANEQGLFKRDLKVFDDEINLAAGKDFRFKVNDKFGYAYDIKASDLVKRDSPTEYILSKYQKRIEKAIQEVGEKGVELNAKEFQWAKTASKKEVKELLERKKNDKLNALKNLSEKARINLEHIQTDVKGKKISTLNEVNDIVDEMVEEEGEEIDGTPILINISAYDNTITLE